MRFFAPSRLGPKRSLTPEGFLLCEDVPLARTGTQLYGPGEVPITPGADGTIRIDRDPDEVFRPETIASGNGKYVTIDHPPVDVTPDNCKELGRGHGMNVHRGEGAFDDVLFGDLLISCPETIRLINERALREISLGYDADYVEIAPGHGRQSKIVINHIALLPHGESRCGPRCSIGDHASADCKFRDIGLSKHETDYQSTSPNAYTCAGCRHFAEPDSCALVAGLIAPEGWCRLFEPPVVATTDVYAKQSQSAVDFEHPATGARHCSQCLRYRAVGAACTLVEGRVDPADWCKLFKLKPFQDSAGALLAGELERRDRHRHGPLVARGHRTTDPPPLKRKRPFHVHVHL